MEITALSPALEDYLEAILVLQKTKPEVKVADIAEFLSVTMASVTGSMKKLAARKLIRYEKRKRVCLTQEGNRIAETVYGRHQDLYAFYHDVLCADGETAEQSACRVEHVLDPAIIEKIMRLTRWIKALPEDALKDFRKEVCGVKSTDERGHTTLDNLTAGAKAVIIRMEAKGEIGRRIRDMGLTKGTEVQIVRAAPLGDPVDIKVKGYHLSLRKSEASGITVKKII